MEKLSINVDNERKGTEVERVRKIDRCAQGMRERKEGEIMLSAEK